MTQLLKLCFTVFPWNICPTQRNSLSSCVVRCSSPPLHISNVLAITEHTSMILVQGTAQTMVKTMASPAWTPDAIEMRVYPRLLTLGVFRCSDPRWMPWEDCQCHKSRHIKVHIVFQFLFSSDGSFRSAIRCVEALLGWCRYSPQLPLLQDLTDITKMEQSFGFFCDKVHCELHRRKPWD